MHLCLLEHPWIFRDRWVQCQLQAAQDPSAARAGPAVPICKHLSGFCSLQKGTGASLHLAGKKGLPLHQGVEHALDTAQYWKLAWKCSPVISNSLRSQTEIWRGRGEMGTKRVSSGGEKSASDYIHTLTKIDKWRSVKETFFPGYPADLLGLSEISDSLMLLNRFQLLWCVKWILLNWKR